MAGLENVYSELGGAVAFAYRRAGPFAAEYALLAELGLGRNR
jgi:hypothetical protein